LDGDEAEIFDEADFFLHEGFRIANSGEHAVITGEGEGTFADIFFGDEEGVAGGLVGILRAVGEERGEALLDVFGDVDDEGGADVGVEAGIEDFEGTPGSGWRAGSGWGFDLGKTGDEGGFVTEDSGGSVVRVTGQPVGHDENARAELPEDSGDLEFIFPARGDVAVGKIERFAPGDAEELGCGCGFAGAVLRGAAGAALAAGEIEDGGASAEGAHVKQSSAAGLLYVVAMGCEGEDIYWR
jgi:hypothetical protein